jgi:hypothetical protein
VTGRFRALNLGPLQSDFVNYRIFALRISVEQKPGTLQRRVTAATTPAGVVLVWHVGQQIVDTISIDVACRYDAPRPRQPVEPRWLRAVVAQAGRTSLSL